MFAIAVTTPGQLDVVEVPNPIPGPYEARIRTELAALCNLTDRKVIEGHFPGVEDYPLLLGHETVGLVEEVGDKVRNFKVGDRVVGALVLNTTSPNFASGWGGFAEYTIAGDHWAMVEDGVADPDHNWYDVYEIMTVVPPDIPVEAAVMLCTWREVLGSMTDFGLEPDTDLLIFGCGPVGLSYVKFARLLGFNRIMAVDPNQPKLELAREMGADQVATPADIDAGTALSPADKFDAIIDAVGKEQIMPVALRHIKTSGSICIYGILDKPVVQTEHGLGPLNFSVKFHQWPIRASERQAQDQLCDWVRRGKLDPQAFISAEYPIFEIAAAYPESVASKHVKTVLRYPG
jgi:threonine dehydrogenase-like Zn-dependent dehydrogenase